MNVVFNVTFLALIYRIDFFTSGLLTRTSVCALTLALARLFGRPKPTSQYSIDFKLSSSETDYQFAMKK